MSLTESSPVLAFNAFESQLKTLCLKEFPCGIGTWKENHGSSRKQLELDQVETKFVVTLKDYGAGHEKTETLEELVHAKKSPWNLDYSWSDEAKSLREIAVRSPWLIDDKFIMRHFKTLRIIDKEITEVDEGFLNFANLEALTLSANYLRTVNSCHLPKKLKVLELCGNMISHLADLCMTPPPLTHLGLGHNLLTMVDDYISHQYWPELLSLDLSQNNLTDLIDIIRKLNTLPKLRNLVMQGNPLSLVPGYRGYTIDSLRKLDFLDDLSISADERHLYKGLAKRKEYILDEAKIALRVELLKGIPMPEEQKNPEELPEFPIVTRKYYVEFMFPEDSSTNAEIFHLLHNDRVGEDDFSTEEATTHRTAHSQLDGSVLAMTDMDSLHQASTTKDEQLSEFLQSDQHPGTDMISQGNLSPHSAVTSVLPGDETPHNRPNMRLGPIKSSSVTWSEDMELNWVQVVTRDDLMALRDFCNKGIKFSVMEDKILSYPADQIHDGMVTPSGSKSGKSKDKSKKEEKPKDVKGPKNRDSKSAKGNKKETTKKEDPKKKKKKGEPDIDLHHMPPEVSTIADFHLDLSELLEGEHIASGLFVKRIQEIEGSQTPTFSETSSKKTKKDMKKPGSAKKKDPKDTKEARKSPKGEKKAADKGAKPKPDTSEEELAPPPPPLLEVQVSMAIHHWETAQDSLKQMAGEEEDTEAGDVTGRVTLK